MYIKTLLTTLLPETNPFKIETNLLHSGNHCDDHHDLSFMTHNPPTAQTAKPKTTYIKAHFPSPKDTM